MPEKISASVGASGVNRYEDVLIVQHLLIHNGFQPGASDGRCSPNTVRAIVDFQSRFSAHPDGRVDPDGNTLRRLNNPDYASLDVPVPLAPDANNAEQNLLARVLRPSADSINHGLVAVNNDYMLQTLGQPRESYSDDCQPMTNVTLRRHVVTESVGRFKVTGLAPAVESLTAALAQVEREQPAVYAALGTAGMLCCRYVRGSTASISNHSWGTAIDFTLNGVLDRRGDDLVQVGLTLIASIMNQHGWYWGAAFRTEDAMHYEASRSLIAQWASQLR